MKVFGLLEGAQLENIVGTPANLPTGRIWLDITNPFSGDPKLWTGSAVISMNPGSFSSFSGTVSIAQGGTGQGTAVLGFGAISPLTTKGDIIGYTGGANVRLPVGTDGQLLSADSSQATGLKWINPASGSGTVTSVGLNVPASILSVAGSPVTAAGGFNVTLVNQNANLGWFGPAAGGPAAPTFRAMVTAAFTPLQPSHPVRIRVPTLRWINRVE